MSLWERRRLKSPASRLFTQSFIQVYKKNQNSGSLAFLRGIHRWPVDSSHKWPVTRKMFPFDNVIMFLWGVFTFSICSYHSVVCGLIPRHYNVSKNHQLEICFRTVFAVDVSDIKSYQVSDPEDGGYDRTTATHSVDAQSLMIFVHQYILPSNVSTCQVTVSLRQIIG